MGLATAVLFAAVLLRPPAIFAQTKDPLSGRQLHADAARYASLGVHRFGTDTDRATTQWIADELRAAGFEVELQSFWLGQQYFVDRVALEVDGSYIDALPFWWPPRAQASFTFNGTIAADNAGSAQGRAVLIRMPFDGGAYMSDKQRNAIALAAARSPSLILLAIDVPSELQYAYNVEQRQAPWPVPVLVIGTRSLPKLREAQGAGTPITATVQGRYEQSVRGRNVVGRLDRGAARTIVISTPTTGWFTCACERGSGVAVFLGLARAIAASKTNANFVFVATAGHEVGQGGMSVFLQRDPPTPDQTRLWMHLGASLACYEWRKDRRNQWRTDRKVDARRTLYVSPSLAPVATEAFGKMTLKTVSTDQGPPVGELRDVAAAGYGSIMGMAAGHHFFHTPADSIATTGPEALEPVARAHARALRMVMDAKPQG